MHDLRIVLTVLALLAAMALCGVLGLRQRLAIVVLALLSFVWLTLDSDFEGDVLITFTNHNGLTASDLVGVAGFVAAIGLWVRLWRRRRR
jgi:hypothetical protein